MKATGRDQDTMGSRSLGSVFDYLLSSSSSSTYGFFSDLSVNLEPAPQDSLNIDSPPTPRAILFHRRPIEYGERLLHHPIQSVVTSTAAGVDDDGSEVVPRGRFDEGRGRVCDALGRPFARRAVEFQKAVHEQDGLVSVRGW